MPVTEVSERGKFLEQTQAWVESYLDGNGRILRANLDIEPNQIVVEDTAVVR